MNEMKDKNTLFSANFLKPVDQQILLNFALWGKIPENMITRIKSETNNSKYKGIIGKVCVRSSIFSGKCENDELDSLLAWHFIRAINFIKIYIKLIYKNKFEMLIDIIKYI